MLQSPICPSSGRTAKALASYFSFKFLSSYIQNAGGESKPWVRKRLRDMHLSREALRRGAENTRPRSCRWRTLLCCLPLLCSRSPCVSLSLSLSLLAAAAAGKTRHHHGDRHGICCGEWRDMLEGNSRAVYTRGVCELSANYSLTFRGVDLFKRFLSVICR